MPSSSEELRNRTKQFALMIIRFSRFLPKSPEAQVIAKQLLRSGTSVGANYRAACRARSHAEFASKLGVVVEEADESVYWIELLVESGSMDERRSMEILNEARELTAIFTKARQTARSR